MEIWKDIPGYDGIYQVSSYGSVKSLKFGKEKILKQCLNGHGYFHVNLCKGYKCKTIRSHILVAMAFLNHIPNGTQKLVVDHIDNNRLNNRFDNLQLITQRENSSKDKIRLVGASWHKRRSKWQSSIYFNGTPYHLGYFNTEQDALNAYQLKLKSLYI